MTISNHFIISGALSCILFLFYSKVTNTEKLYNLLTLLLVLNFLSFNVCLFSTGNFDYKIHLPFHLCYLAELGILISIIFKNKKLYPWLVLSSLGGGITGFTNSNLLPDSMTIEYTHLYLSHFNLLFFTIIAYKDKLIISKKNYSQSILFNGLLFIFVIFFNKNFNSNYWFTNNKPDGQNLTCLLPAWPGYLLVLILIGFLSYYLTFKLFLKNKGSIN